MVIWRNQNMRFSLPPRTLVWPRGQEERKKRKWNFQEILGGLILKKSLFFSFFFSFFSSSTAFSPPRIKNQRDGGDGEVGRCAAGSRVTGERGVVKCDVTPFLVLTSFHSFFSLFRLFLPPLTTAPAPPAPVHVQELLWVGPVSSAASAATPRNFLLLLMFLTGTHTKRRPVISSSWLKSWL